MNRKIDWQVGNPMNVLFYFGSALYIEKAHENNAGKVSQSCKVRMVNETAIVVLRLV